jgi:hypothetical protein
VANLFAIHSVSDSLIQFLERSYPQALRDDHPATFRIVSVGALSLEEPAIPPDTLVLLLHRITVSEHLRNARRPSAPDSVPGVGVDLHFLLVAWTIDVEFEHVILAWAAELLHRTPILDASSLTPSGGWTADDVIHVVPAELSVEDTMRIWDAVAPTYRLCLPYVARVVRIEAAIPAEPARVVATRRGLGDRDA